MRSPEMRGDTLSRYYFHHLFGPWWQFTEMND